MAMSSFILAVAVGPLLLGPLSEIFGRVIVLHSSNLMFLVFNTLCAISRTKGELIAFRVLSGFGASATFALYGGILNDCWIKEERGKGYAIANFIPLLAPALGPLAASAMLGKLSWRWCFGMTSIFDAIVAVIGLVFLRESYEPVILARRVMRMRKETGNMSLHTKAETETMSVRQLLRKNILRAVTLLVGEPLVWLQTLWSTAAFGTLYIFLSVFPFVWTDLYGDNITIAGLHYLFYGFGLMVGTQLGSFWADRIYLRLKRATNDRGRAEFRLPLSILCSILYPATLLLFGWTAEKRVHWAVPSIATFFFGMAYVVAGQNLVAYNIECYETHAASAGAAVNFTRSIAAFGFPLFAPAMIETLGWGWTGSVLGLVLTVVGLPVPIILWFSGARLRKASKHAAKDEAENE
jgi:MFS family permease